ncbi:MAG: hypothetical protein KAG61_01765 [Bacteriovoracaceae bacterium]|nr:hypothetical protein [Bacteriovoracaceae bacterium]
MSFKKLVEWSSQFCDLPWRQRRSLYHTLVSEIMLQQTTVPTVLGHFDRFLSIYPDISTLAKTDEETIQINWKGLGYYRRARNLLKAAKYIHNELNDVIPLDVAHLIQIPGVGDYTANAIMAMGANLPHICIDANLERVLSRYYTIDSEKGLPLKKELKRGFENGDYLKDIRKLGGRAVNEALMDLGREVCLSKTPRCSQCCLMKKCGARKANMISSFPVENKKKIAKKKESHILKLLRIIVREKKTILVYKKKKGKWLEGQMELPTFIIESEDHSLTQYPTLISPLDKLPSTTYKTIITKYKIQNYILEMSKKEWRCFLKNEELNSKDYFYSETGTDKNLSTATFKALK